MDKTSSIQEKLAHSLTAESTSLIPYLPYLLQDLWELGSCPEEIVALIHKYLPSPSSLRILDLGCGKGAVAVNIAKILGAEIKGIDILPEFIVYAEQKAAQWGVSGLCRFAVEDINESLKTERDYDCIIYGAVGDVLGSPEERLEKLKIPLKPGGWIILNDAYIKNGGTIKYGGNTCLDLESWQKAFDSTGLSLIDSIWEDSSVQNTSDLALISARAQELMEKYPGRRELFEGYIQSQKNEGEDLENSLIGVTWLLRSL